MIPDSNLSSVTAGLEGRDSRADPAAEAENTHPQTASPAARRHSAPAVLAGLPQAFPQAQAAAAGDAQKAGMFAVSGPPPDILSQTAARLGQVVASYTNAPTRMAYQWGFEHAHSSVFTSDGKRLNAVVPGPLNLTLISCLQAIRFVERHQAARGETDSRQNICLALQSGLQAVAYEGDAGAGILCLYLRQIARACDEASRLEPVLAGLSDEHARDLLGACTGTATAGQARPSNRELAQELGKLAFDAHDPRQQLDCRYDDVEPGYTAGFLKALNHAFSSKDTLDARFMLDLHDLAVGAVGRCGPNQFQLHALQNLWPQKGMTNQQMNAVQQMRQLLQVAKSPGATSPEFMSRITPAHFIPQGFRNPQLNTQFDLCGDWLTQAGFEEMQAQADETGLFRVEVIQKTDAGVERVRVASLPMTGDQIHARLDDLCAQFREKLAQTPQDLKLEVICEFLSKVERFHPFPDANGRTTKILLFKLLRDAGLPLCNMDPNHIDGHASHEFAQELRVEMKRMRGSLPIAPAAPEKTPLT